MGSRACNWPVHRCASHLHGLRAAVLNGFEAIKQIRTDESCSHVPIIAVSNHCWDLGWKDKALALGCAECIDKGKVIDTLDDLLQRYAN
jgi:CheY-like chemotaxis protein